MSLKTYIGAKVLDDLDSVLETWRARALQEGAGRAALPELAANAHRQALLVHIADAMGGSGTPFRDRAELYDLLSTLLKLRTGDDDLVLLARELGALGRTLLDELQVWVRSHPAGQPPLADVIDVAAWLAAVPQELTEIAFEIHEREQRAGDARTWNRVQQFANMLSHALNQPLNAALLTAQLMEYTDGATRTPEERALLEQLRRNLLRTDAVLRDAHAAALSRARTANGGRYAFGQVLGEVLAELNGELSARGMRLLLEEPVADVVVQAARVRLILTSLIRHLMQTVDDDAGEKLLRVQCNREPTRAGWSVVVSTEARNQVHAANGAAASFEERAPDGVMSSGGLGLELAREEALLLGGQLEVDGSFPATRICFRLPAEEPAARA